MGRDQTQYDVNIRGIGELWAWRVDAILPGSVRLTSRLGHGQSTTIEQASAAAAEVVLEDQTKPERRAA